MFIIFDICFSYFIWAYTLLSDAMKNIINYYYLLDSTELRSLNENYMFKANKQIFLFCRISEIDINNLMLVLKETNNISYVHTPVYNRNKELITFDGTNHYILFRININQNRFIKVFDLFRLYNDVNISQIKSINRFNWIELWTNKIDYLEYYINLKDSMSDEIRCIFYYFIGLGENAISYLKNIFENTTVTEIDKVSIVHKRSSYKDTLYDLYNPLNFVVDHISRDVSEYLKSMFLDKVYDLNIIENIITNLNLSELGYKLLFARMMFPTFFFDLFDNYESKNFSTKEILDVYNKTKEYEKYISLIYEVIKKTKNINIPRFYWMSH